MPTSPICLIDPTLGGDPATARRARRYDRAPSPRSTLGALPAVSRGRCCNPSSRRSAWRASVACPLARGDAFRGPAAGPVAAPPARPTAYPTSFTTPEIRRGCRPHRHAWPLALEHGSLSSPDVIRAAIRELAQAAARDRPNDLWKALMRRAAAASRCRSTPCSTASRSSPPRSGELRASARSSRSCANRPAISSSPCPSLAAEPRPRHGPAWCVPDRKWYSPTARPAPRRPLSTGRCAPRPAPRTSRPGFAACAPADLPPADPRARGGGAALASPAQSPFSEAIAWEPHGLHPDHLRASLHQRRSSISAIWSVRQPADVYAATCAPAATRCCSSAPPTSTAPRPRLCRRQDRRAGRDLLRLALA